jgi:hypothetical protein
VSREQEPVLADDELHGPPMCWPSSIAPHRQLSPVAQVSAFVLHPTYALPTPMKPHGLALQNAASKSTPLVPFVAFCDARGVPVSLNIDGAPSAQQTNKKMRTLISASFLIYGSAFPLSILIYGAFYDNLEYRPPRVSLS